MKNLLLLPQHEQILEDSAIDPTVATERGYRSVTTKAELLRLGFTAHQCGVPTLLMPIHGVQGEISLYHHRPDHPRAKDGKTIKYEIPRGSKMAVDVHPRIRAQVRDPSVPLIITEGVKKADAAISIGLTCISLIGVWNWRGTNEVGGKTSLPDWESIALKGTNNEPRTVYICFDSDVMLKKQVYMALERLSEFLKQRGACVAYIYLPHALNGSKTGLDDYLAAGHGLEDLMALVSPDLRPVEGASDDGGSAAAEDQTVSQKLLDLAANIELFTSERGEGFVRFTGGGCRQTWPIGSSVFRDWLRREYYNGFGKVCSNQSVLDVLGVLEGRARFDGDRRKLSVRCAQDESDGSIWLDTGDPLWRAVQVTKTGWKIADEPPTLFRRHVSIAPLAQAGTNATAKDIERLRRFVNVRSEHGWRQFVAWLVAACIPEIGHPVLVVHGEQGSAKSTLLRIAKRLIDPSQTELLAEPRDIAQWLQMADHSWLVALDNVSALPGWLSDALCRAVTGEASLKRKLYSDSEDVIVAFRRVIALTGIEVVARNADLLDRSILLGLDPISAENRRSESAVLEEFEAARPILTGALLSLLQGVLAELPSVKKESASDGQLPRMADFANVGIAVERVLGWPEGSFMAAYLEGIGEQHEEALSAYLISEPLLKIIGDEWSGTASELLEALEISVEDRQTKRSGWPRTGRSLAGQLKRMAPNLRAAGITLEYKTTGKRRLIFVTRQSEKKGAIDEAESVEEHEDPFAEAEGILDGSDANDDQIQSLSDSTIDEDVAYQSIRR